MKLATTDVFKALSRINKNLITLTQEDLEKCQQIDKETLEDILQICNQFAIEYHLTGGSALGAVRHKGYIPWDDDIDIDMARKDIDLFLHEFAASYSEKYWIHGPHSKGIHCVPNINIRRKNTVFQGCVDPDPNECGIPVDIAIMENTFDNVILRNCHGFVSLMLGFIVSCRRFYMNREYLLKLAGDDEDIRKTFTTKINIGRLFSGISLEKWVAKYDRWNAICKNNNSKFVVVPTGRKHFFGEMYLREDFASTMEAVFEGLTVKIPKSIDKYLKHMYGENYMQIPPVEKREQHTLVKFEINLERK